MTPIEADEPSRWTDLQEAVARILRECGLDAHTNQPLLLARGTVNVDVHARDAYTTPASSMIVECKLWKRRVPKHAVHSLRTVVADAGANVGLLVSVAGAQRGAVEATEHTNVQLVDWASFQGLFVRRWYERFFIPTLRTEADPLVEYTEPMNSRIFGRADKLPATQQKVFRALREKHFDLGMGLVPLWFAMSLDVPEVPDLPLRRAFPATTQVHLPEDILDAQALRQLLEALTDHYRSAIREFDSVFGGRV